MAVKSDIQTQAKESFHGSDELAVKEEALVGRNEGFSHSISSTRSNKEGEEVCWCWHLFVPIRFQKVEETVQITKENKYEIGTEDQE